MRVADWIMKRLADEGLKHMFLLPGGGAMYLNDALACEPRITPVPCHHEQTCGIAAEAYGRTGHPDNPGFGAALVTAGPGATNVITPVAGAWIDSIPLFVISGQVKLRDRKNSLSLRQRGVQEVDIIPMINSITKYSATIERVEDVGLHIETALQVMRSGRPGPVWIEVPLDIQAMEMKQFVPLEPPLIKSEKSALEDIKYKEILDLISRAERPLILAGHGIRLSGGASLFRKFYSILGIPVVTSWNALDLIEHSDPLFLGCPGVVSTRSANIAIQNCDLLVVIGCNVNYVMSGYNPQGFARNAKIIYIDVDKAQLEQSELKLAHSFLADARNFFEGFLRVLSDQKMPPKEPWLNQCIRLRQEYMNEFGDESLSQNVFDTYSAVALLSRFIPDGITIATGSAGFCIEVFYSQFYAKSNQRVFHTSGLGSMGYGVPAAIGAYFGSGKRPTVLMESDGSLMQNIQELSVIANHNMPITAFIFDNEGYDSIRTTQRNYFESRFIGTGAEAGLGFPNLHSVITSFGVPCVEISSVNEFEKILRLHNFSKGPVFYLCKIKKGDYLRPKVSAIPLEDGRIVSMPIEDMTPLLPVEKLKEYLVGPLTPVSLSARSAHDCQ